MDFIAFTPSTAETATSYLSVADADEIIATGSDSAAWAALGNPTKQIMLNQASLAVDGAMAYESEKTSVNQLLKFPRGGNTTLPSSLLFATAELAAIVAKDDTFKNITSESVSKLRWTFKGNGTGVPDSVYAFLKPLRKRTVQLA